MSNPFFSAFGRQVGNDPMSQMISEFKRFSESFKGDPRQEIQRLLDSGEMTQQQLNQLQSIAGQFRQLFN
jgi:hypothetical protein